MGDVCHRISFDAAGYRSDSLKVDHSGVSRRSAENQPGFVLVRKPFEFIVVDLLGICLNSVWHDLVAASGEIERMPVSEMTAVRKIHSENSIAVVEDGEINR